ncbi:Inner membrane protein YgaP [Pirellula sp. SH-Sr6A]|uniref:rhodanese-like domain-containing protein n=1 Tax=Pirellula sp. SH-Sr6A TaxID=1632865 RepID=UPI00078D323B|nr:rhodanese-like domain-containing protein [Pirellula sp. SH-Sr6A]AMV34501.1 Inner membrane protein YgaP [Pirellula sp. SH-Sr6A]
MKTIQANELHQLIQSGETIDLVDVRTPVEFREVHVSVAKNMPLDQLRAQEVTAGRKSSSDKPIYVICRSGSRGQQACAKLEQAGLNVVNVEGGTNACVAAGLPVVRGKKAMSLERQVRIAAGSLVLTGILLSRFVHPYWIGLSGFVGAGLIFAGITDSCAMGMLIAKMPWNRVGASNSNSPTSCSVKAPASR